MQQLGAYERAWADDDAHCSERVLTSPSQRGWQALHCDDIYAGGGNMSAIPRRSAVEEVNECTHRAEKVGVEGCALPYFGLARPCL